MIRRQGEAGVLAEVVDGLHQALAEGGFADDQGAIVILQRAGDDLGGRSGIAIDQHDDRESLAVVAVGGCVDLVGIGAAALRDDGLALGEQVVADLDRLAQQAAGVIAQVKNEPMQVLEAVDGVDHFLGRGFLELGEMDVAHTGPNLVGQIDGGVRNLIAHQVEDQRLGLPLANHGDLNVCAFGSLQRFGDEVGGHAVGRFAVDGRDHVAGPNAGAERRRVLIRGDDVNLVACCWMTMPTP